MGQFLRAAPLDQAWQDVRIAFRQLLQAPAFAIVATMTLALGIGGSTAIFTIVDAVLLRPLGFAEPERLAVIRPTSGARLSAAYLHDWRVDSRAFADIAGWYDEPANLTGGGMPVEVRADRATTNFFAVLGTTPQLGRTFTTTENLADVGPEVVLSHGFWQRHYGGDPSVIGRAMTLDDRSVTIVGVMPARFAVRTNELPESRAEVWLPLPLEPGNRAGMGGYLNAVGRLAAGATTDDAQAELSAIARQIEEQYPSYSKNWGVQVVPLHEATVRDVRLRLLVLFGAVALLLLIACANVANLVLSRAAARRTEMAVRQSLGATPARLVRQALTESLVLAAAGGALGVFLAVGGTRLLVSAVPAGLGLPRSAEVGVDARVLLFSILVTLMTAILFGLAPAVGAAAQSAPHSVLRDGTRGVTGNRGRSRARGALAACQVALAFLLLAGAGLLGRTFWELSGVDPGFDMTNVVTMRTTLAAPRYTTDDRVRLFGTQLIERIERLPQVASAGLVNYLPLSNIGAGSSFTIEGRPALGPEDQPGSWISIVGGNYFDAMGIPLLRGRLPGRSDTDRTQPVVVIDEALARRYWPQGNPIGERLTWRTRQNQTFAAEVIGVAGAVRWTGLSADPQPTAYWWFPQRPDQQLTIVVRTTGDPAAMSRLVAAEVAALDPSQPIADVRAMRDLVAADLDQSRFTMLLIGAFAAAALLLAAVGLYGVIAVGVTERTREIGVRMALGAERRDVIGMVMRGGLLPAAIGLVAGLVTALALGRLLASLLFGVAPTDPVTLVGGAVFLTVVTAIASYLPARRAARLDPAVTLRAE
jgi:putative ABC transport system permease protein